MKSDLAVFEIKHLLKKFEKQNRIKTVAIIGIGLASLIAVIILIISKLKKKGCPVSYDGLDYEDWDDLDDLDYEDYDYDDDYDDGHVYEDIDEEETEENE